jgi:hypothetical protein
MTNKKPNLSLARYTTVLNTIELGIFLHNFCMMTALAMIESSKVEKRQ